MKRKGLRLQLAEAIEETLGPWHALTIPNAKRYITQDVRRLWRIRDTTVITMADWIVAVQVCREDRRNHFARLSKNDPTPRRDRFLLIMRMLRITGSEPLASTSPYVP